METGLRLRPKICMLRLSRTKYLEQNREIQQNWTGQENFDIDYFAVFNCYDLSLISGRESEYYLHRNS